MQNRWVPNHLPDDDTVVVGVSGGPDSLCLLDLAWRNVNTYVVVAHFNHRLRPEADREVEYVRNIAEQMRLPFVTESADVQGYANEHKLSLEEAARILRYRFLFAQAHAHQAVAVAVGHTADDQVETVLMHLLRGAGLSGLKGMTGVTYLTEFDWEIPVVRPILHLWRGDTEAYCREHGLQPILDPSNADETYFRNRLRHSLIPELETYNPRIKEALLRMTQTLAGDYEALTETVDAAWPKVVCAAGADYVAFHFSELEGIPHGLRRNIFRRAMESLRPSMRNLDFAALERASNFVDAKANAFIPELAPRQVDLTEGLYLYREGDTIYLATLSADLPSAHWPQIEGEYGLQVSTRVSFDDNFSLSASDVNIETARQFAHENGDSFVAWMDADVTGDKFTIRTRRPGDHFQPLGMDGHSIKLSDFFVNVKLPERAREKWPLVLVGEEITWVPGFRLAHPFRIKEGTKRAVRLNLQKS
jgi:tRNA(Ile)-lysidine synthase